MPRRVEKRWRRQPRSACSGASCRQARLLLHRFLHVKQISPACANQVADSSTCDSRSTTLKECARPCLGLTPGPGRLRQEQGPASLEGSEHVPVTVPFATEPCSFVTDQKKLISGCQSAHSSVASGKFTPRPIAL